MAHHIGGRLLALAVNWLNYRLRGRIERILDWATVRELPEGANPARWKGHLDYLLASPNKVAPVKNYPALLMGVASRVHGRSCKA